MVTITLPDGSQRTYEGSVTGSECARDIGPGLAKAALAIWVDGDLWDLSRTINQSAAVSIVTD